ncbi:MAG: AraC family transcriptional regulator [Bacteroidetes bacterium]|nr:MAG: AraC family transcriptional regulator [Bacteroidota bacterium]
MIFFEFNSYSALLLIFFVHGLVYAGLLWRKAMLSAMVSHKWLAAFLVLCSSYIAPWMLGFAGWYDNQPYRDVLFYMPFQHLFWMGPCIYFYVQSLLNPAFEFGKRQRWHLLPGALYACFAAIVFLTDKVWLKRSYFLASGTDPDFDEWYQILGFVSMLCYLLLSVRYHRLYRRLVQQATSYADLLQFKWIRSFLLAFLAILVLKAVFYVLNLFYDLSYVGNWWYFILFSVLFYYVAIEGHSNTIVSTVAFKPQVVANRGQLLLPMATAAGAPPQYAEAVWIDLAEAIENDEELAQLDTWRQKLLQALVHQKAYANAELTLSELARMLQTNPGLVSRMVNRGFNTNFNDWVNTHRIDAVKQMLKQGEHKQQTLVGIAYDCGFNSKATFNRAFKKHTGQTPQDWIKTL